MTTDCIDVCSSRMELHKCTKSKLLQQNELHNEQVRKTLIQLKKQMSLRNQKVYEDKKSIKLLRQEKSDLVTDLMKIDINIRKFQSLFEQLEAEGISLQENIDLLMNELSELSVEKKVLEEGRSEKKNELKKSFEALVKAMAYHKQYLACYIDLDRADSNTFSLHFFYKLTEKISNDPNYYVKLDHSNKKWKVLEIKPSITCGEEVSALLEDTNDIQGFLAHVRDMFSAIRERELAA